jgi:hypothetical protein
MHSMGRIFNTSGGFRKLHTFNFATIIHLGTISFCKRYIPWKDDPLGKTLGQMVGASRSGKQNIIEGSERAKTSSETEIRLTDVAKRRRCFRQGLRRAPRLTRPTPRRARNARSR